MPARSIMLATIEPFVDEQTIELILDGDRQANRDT